MTSLLPLAIAVVSFVPGAAASAQSERPITGVGRDAGGSGIPGTTVTVTNQAAKESKSGRVLLGTAQRGWNGAWP